MKRPSFQFYPADWRKDAALQSCSVAAQGLWINLLCIAHECEPYGHLVVNGKPMQSAQVARLVGLSAKECDRLLAELIEAGVASVSEEGTFYSRRMVRDEEVRCRRADGGKAGSEFGHLGAEHGAKGGRPRKRTGDKKPPSNPPPLSSSSSSSSESPSEPNGSVPPGTSTVSGGDPVKALFDAGVRVLTAAGETEKHARSIVGQLRKRRGDDGAMQIITAASRATTPVEYIQAAIRKPSDPPGYTPLRFS